MEHGSSFGGEPNGVADLVEDDGGSQESCETYESVAHGDSADGEEGGGHRARTEGCQGGNEVVQSEGQGALLHTGAGEVHNRAEQGQEQGTISREGAREDESGLSQGGVGTERPSAPAYGVGGICCKGVSGGFSGVVIPRVPLFPLPLFVCFREDLLGVSSLTFEHIFNENAALVTRANESILLLNNMARGDSHNSNVFSIGESTLEGVLTPAVYA